MANLTASELPLVLLAIAGHPDDTLRASLLHRLDEAIDAQPSYPTPPRSRRQLRALFDKQDRRRCGGLVLGPRLGELAVRLMLLAFSKPVVQRGWRLLIGDNDSSDRKPGYLIDFDLTVIDLRGSALTRHRLVRKLEHAHFMTGSFRRRLSEIRRGESPVKAVCRVTNRIELEFSGPIPWSEAEERTGTRGCVGNMPARARSPYPGWEYERDGQQLRLWPDSPEGLIQLTAGMAAGKALIFQGPHRGRSGAILVQLREFDGDSIELPVKVTPSHEETWLSRIPAPLMTLTDDDRLALARWAYPLPNWTTTDLTERLF
jgi:hypothetical protein